MCYIQQSQFEDTGKWPAWRYHFYPVFCYTAFQAFSRMWTVWGTRGASLIRLGDVFPQPLYMVKSCIISTRIVLHHTLWQLAPLLVRSTLVNVVKCSQCASTVCFQHHKWFLARYPLQNVTALRPTRMSPSHPLRTSSMSLLSPTRSNVEIK